MPEILPAAESIGEGGGDSPSRDGLHQQSSGGAQGPAAYQTLPQHNREYLQASYWDERFKHEEAYEWYANYRQAGAGAVTSRPQAHCKQLRRPWQASGAPCLQQEPCGLRALMALQLRSLCAKLPGTTLPQQRVGVLPGMFFLCAAGS